MMKYCKNCKYAEENDDVFSPKSMFLGIAIIGAPMPRTGLFGDDDYECNNIKYGASGSTLETRKQLYDKTRSIMVVLDKHLSRRKRKS